MSGQVDRLQALLHRVQQNRGKPRMDGGTQREAMRPESRPAPGPDPRAALASEQRDRRELPTSGFPPPRVDAAPPGVTASAGSYGEPLIIDPPVPQPSKSVVQVVSKHPPSVALSFGELLRRSLSLRPR